MVDSVQKQETHSFFNCKRHTVFAFVIVKNAHVFAARPKILFSVSRRLKIDVFFKLKTWAFSSLWNFQWLKIDNNLKIILQFACKSGIASKNSLCDGNWRLILDPYVWRKSSKSKKDFCGKISLLLIIVQKGVQVVYSAFKRLWKLARETFAPVWSQSKVFISKTLVLKSSQKIWSENTQKRRPCGSLIKDGENWPAKFGQMCLPQIFQVYLLNLSELWTLLFSLCM